MHTGEGGRSTVAPIGFFAAALLAMATFAMALLVATAQPALAQNAFLSAPGCSGGAGEAVATVSNTSSSSMYIQIQAAGLSTGFSVPAGTDRAGALTGITDGTHEVRVVWGTAPHAAVIASAVQTFDCQPDHTAAFGGPTCNSTLNPRGQLYVTVSNNSMSTTTYLVRVGPQSSVASAAPGTSRTVTVPGIPDGRHSASVYVHNGPFVAAVGAQTWACEPPAPPDTATIRTPLCATSPVDRGTLRFTVTNNGPTTRYYDLTVGPHGHNNLDVRAGTTRTFTLKGIPNGSHTATVHLDGSPSALATKVGLVWACHQTIPTTDDINFGEPACARAVIDKGALTFTVTNNGSQTRYYNFVVGPHGRANYAIAAGRTATFTLTGIPNGRHETSVQEGTNILANGPRLDFDCEARQCGVFERSVGFPVENTDVVFTCKLRSQFGNFDIYYITGEATYADVPDDHELTTAEAQIMADRLETARSDLIALGFEAPTDIIPVYVWPREDGVTGYSPPGRIEMKSQFTNSILGIELLRHELAHQFQWRYSGTGNYVEALLSLDWIEGQAEWMACPTSLYPRTNVSTGYCRDGRWNSFYDDGHSLPPFHATQNYSAAIFYRAFEKRFGIDKTVNVVEAGQHARDAMWNTPGFASECRRGTPAGLQCSNWLHSFRRAKAHKYDESRMNTWVELEAGGTAAYFDPDGTSGTLEVTVFGQVSAVVRVSMTRCDSNYTKTIAGSDTTPYTTFVIDYTGCRGSSRLVVTTISEGHHYSEVRVINT